MVRYFKNPKLIKRFGERLKKFRSAAGLTLQQVHTATGLSKRQITYTESGNVNTSISHLGLYAEFFGVDPHVMLNFNEPIPDEEALKQGVKKFLKSRGQDTVLFFKQNEGATSVLNKLLETDFLSSPRYAKEIIDYCKDKYKFQFTTTRISKVLDNLHKRGLVKKLKTNKKTKYQYQKVN